MPDDCNRPAWLDGIEDAHGVYPPWPPACGVYFERTFVCICGEVWTDLHDSNCNDKCPACDLEIEYRASRARDALTGAYAD